jgi:Tfp pilus assembly protein PilN
MRAINLLPSDEARRGLQLTPPLATGIASVVLVTTVLVAGFLLGSSKVADSQARLDAAQVELALVPPPPPPAPGAEFNLKGQHAARVTALQTAIGGRIPWDRVLRELALVLPQDVWLNRLSVVTPTLNAVDSFQIAGKAYSQDGVARLLSRLQVVPELSNVRLAESNAVEPGTRNGVDFRILASIRTAGAES